MRTTARVSLVGAFALIGVFACAPTARNGASDRLAIDSLRARAQAAENAGDADALLALFSDDAVMMPPNRPAVLGVSAARAFVPEFFKAFALSEQFTSHE